MDEFASPTKADLDRALARLVEDRFQELMAERSSIVSEFIKAGGSTHSRLPLTIADAFDQGSRLAIDDAIDRAWSYLPAAKDVAELGAWTCPHLEKLKVKLLDQITGGTGNHLAVQKAYESKYQARIDEALKDIQIGVVRGEQRGKSSKSAAVAVVNVDAYVAAERLDKLRAAKSTSFDLSKLIRMCEELNLAWSNESYYSVAALLRALLDHVPPIFAQPNFVSVVAQTSGKSLKAHLEALGIAARNNADLHLHEQIKAQHTLPTSTQVDQRSHFYHLLGEIISRVTAQAAKGSSKP